MPDFRDELYRRYVTTFKGMSGQMSGAELGHFWRWCAYKYLPLLADVGRDAPVLELGCGPGYVLEFLARAGFTNVQGIDISEEQTRLAKEQGLRAEAADAFEFLATREGAFGAIVAIDFLEHFTKVELVRLVPLIHGALNQGGILLVQTANGQGLFPRQVIYGDFTHLTVFTPQSLAQVLRRFGFDQFVFRETGPARLSPRGVIDVVLWGAIKGIANAVRRVETGKHQQIWTENFICRAVRV
jgi:2-polyprenyl-3-methyl-5-hydroxy-6-metoxy-1,4-benzoquinol methylase